MCLSLNSMYKLLTDFTHSPHVIHPHKVLQWKSSWEFGCCKHICYSSYEDVFGSSREFLLTSQCEVGSDMLLYLQG